jgi:hypothetical protein
MDVLNGNVNLLNKLNSFMESLKTAILDPSFKWNDFYLKFKSINDFQYTLQNLLIQKLDQTISELKGISDL